MLGKLLKYDLRRIYKKILVVYVLALVVAGLTRLTDFSLDGDATIITVLHVLCYNATYILCVGIAFMTCVVMWRDFRRQMYGDESYLTHTLPIAMKTLWGAKFIESVIMVFSSVLVVSVTLLMIVGTNGGINIVQGVFGYGREGMTPLLALGLVVLMQWAFIVQSGLAGMIIANRMPARRGFHAITWGIIFYTLGIVIMLGMLAIWDKIAITEIDLASSLEEQILRNDALMYSMFYGVAGLYVVLTVAVYFINYKILSRGVNID